MEYIVFVHNNTETPTTDEQWQRFFDLARASGLFLGGSEIAKATQLGKNVSPSITSTIDGFMRFDASSKSDLMTLLEEHPVIQQGGTLEVCEMPKS